MQLVDDFNATVNQIINTVEKKTRNDLDLANLDTLKRRIKLGKSTLGDDILCTQSMPIFMKYKKQIMTCDESFFLGLNIANECRNIEISSSDEYVFSLIDAMKIYYSKASDTDRQALWSNVKRLFELSLEYSIMHSRN